MMTKRNASEYIIGSIQRYPVLPTRDTVIAGLSSGLARWACRSSVAHSSRVGRLSWLSPRRSVSCIRVALHAVSTGSVDDPACNIPMRYTDARDAYVCA